MESRPSNPKSSNGDTQTPENDAEGRLDLTSVLDVLRRQKLRIAFFTAWVFGAYLALRFDPSALQLYVILTVFYLIFTNLGERRSGLSAYSVFNRNCERIMGQPTAEQFDNEVRRRVVDFNSTEPPRSVRTTEVSGGDELEKALSSLRTQIQSENRAARRRPAFPSFTSRSRKR